MPRKKTGKTTTRTKTVKEEKTAQNQLTLRPYQQECVDKIDSLDGGSHLIALATGLGKTVIFSHIRRQGRVLILSHHDELVRQPQKYYTDCSFGIEKAGEHSNGEDVVSASVQSMVRRLDKFDPDEFDTIITDEAHHAAAPSYKKIYEHFNFRLHLGFTATPSRGDKVRLDDVYDDILAELNMEWGIKNGYLSDIRCLQADIGYDISKVKRYMGDYSQEQLAKAINIGKANDGIAKAYRELAVGRTLIFAASVAHAKAISKLIPGSEIVTAKTPDEDRKNILARFAAGKLKCLINCMIFTEGTDIPMVETIIIARPTENESLYTQMVGRGTRLFPGKQYLTLIDCVGYTGKHKLCTAATLFGLDPDKIPARKKKKLNDVMLSDMENTIEKLIDMPDAWILKTNEVQLFAQENHFNLHGVYWRKRPDNYLACDIGDGKRLFLTPIDELGQCCVIYQNGTVSERSGKMKYQEALDRCHEMLMRRFEANRPLWDQTRVDVWGAQPASEKQKAFVKNLLQKSSTIEKYGETTIDVDKLTKFQAGILIDRLNERKIPTGVKASSIGASHVSPTVPVKAGSASINSEPKLGFASKNHAKEITIAGQQMQPAAKEKQDSAFVKRKRGNTP